MSRGGGLKGGRGLRRRDKEIAGNIYKLR